MSIQAISSSQLLTRVFLIKDKHVHCVRRFLNMVNRKFLSNLNFRIHLNLLMLCVFKDCTQKNSSLKACKANLTNRLSLKTRALSVKCKIRITLISKLEVSHKKSTQIIVSTRTFRLNTKHHQPISHLICYTLRYSYFTL
jgi:hypothetical protein